LILLSSSEFARGFLKTWSPGQAVRTKQQHARCEGLRGTYSYYGNHLLRMWMEYAFSVGEPSWEGISSDQRCKM